MVMASPFSVFFLIFIWLSGFYIDKAGCYHDGWIGSKQKVDSSWLLTVDVAGGGSGGLMRLYGGKIIQHHGASTTGASAQITVNMGISRSQESDFQLAYAAVWNRHLSTSELKNVEKFLIDRFKLMFK